MTRRALVLGCGGTLGFAWSVAALAAFERETGRDVREADVIVGTSAGAELAVLLGSGIGIAEIRAALDGAAPDPRLERHLAAHPGMAPPLPGPGLPGLGLVAAFARGRVDLLAALAGTLPRGRGDAAWLRELGDALATHAGWVPHPATWLVGADIRTGERVPFGAPGSPAATLADALAASWAIPGWFPPVRIAGREYVDGGTVSPTSADLLLGAADVEEVVVVPPMSTAGGAPAHGLSRLERVARRAMTRRVDTEVDHLRTAGMRVVRIEPGPAELAAMGPNFMDLRRRASALSAFESITPARVRAAVEEAW